MRLHLSGPMTSRPNHNKANFNALATLLRDHGHTVFNPAELNDALPYNELLALNLDWLCREAEGIVRLSGWWQSPGATAEVFVADALKLHKWTYIAGNFVYESRAGLDWPDRLVPEEVKI